MEPAIPASKLSKSKGIDTIVSFFNKGIVNKIKTYHDKFDLIITNNTFANIDDVNQWMSNIKDLLNEKGYFVFESSYLLDVVKNKVFDFIYHEHLSYFSMTSVDNLCKRHGLTPSSYTHLRTHETDSYLVFRLLLERKKYDSV